ncbi:hypothetical protein JRO89_XS02G0033700 [Xanthoceras sorbifolium]|uniref:Protein DETOXIFICATION n=1 Tax=Xanthoceras sorbifolium TaxID=99658 RepID=A0ABQ8IEB0_9ROSI|nr:hypothetical protein JRO89_XS02G0033700 [Xanthoceras sorbifolium]
MQIKALARSSSSHTLLQYPDLQKHFRPPFLFIYTPLLSPLKTPPFLITSLPSPTTLHISTPKRTTNRFKASCISPSQELIEEEDPEVSTGNGHEDVSLDLPSDEEEKEVEVVPSNKGEDLASQCIWRQMNEILMFSGPATGLWICAPLMSLISTAMVGQGSSTELAALGPGTVFCDNMNLLFMFLSIATSNMVATSLAKGDKKEVQRQISILLFVGLTCGVLMLLFTQFLGSWALTGFTGPKNVHIVPVASKYVQVRFILHSSSICSVFLYQWSFLLLIRGLSWPAVLYGQVAQSASLGMKDSMGPLKALVVATTVNGIGHLILCRFLGYGIMGAAWATMTSQVISAYMMIGTLNKKGYNPFAISVPSANEFLQMFAIAAPVFVSMFSKVAFYSLITYFATAMGTCIVAAHHVMIQTYGMFVVWGEPLSQTAQSFMPELLHGVNRSLEKAQMLIKSLVIIGAILGVVIGTAGAFIPWLLPNMFTSDLMVKQEMHKVLILFFLSLAVTPCTHSLEGTLLAGRDLKFLSLSMGGCFSLGALLLLVTIYILVFGHSFWCPFGHVKCVLSLLFFFFFFLSYNNQLVSNRGYGLPGCWSALVGFQWVKPARFFLAVWRLLYPNSMLHSKNSRQCQFGKQKAS